MPDRSRIEDRLGGDDEDEGSKRSRSAGNKSTTSNKSSSPSEMTTSDDVETQQDKIEQFKGSSGGSSGKVPRGQVANVLEAMANTLLHTEGKMRQHGDPEKRRKVVETNIWTIIYEQFTDLISGGNVASICEKYGIDWEQDVIQQVIAEQDFEGGVDDIRDSSKHVANVGNGKQFSESDFMDLLLVLGHMLMFTKTLERKFEGSDEPEEKIAAEAASGVSANTIDFLGTFDVVQIAKRHGINWEKDVIESIAEG